MQSTWTVVIANYLIFKKILKNIKKMQINALKI